MTLGPSSDKTGASWLLAPARGATDEMTASLGGRHFRTKQNGKWDGAIRGCDGLAV